MIDIQWQEQPNSRQEYTHETGYVVTSMTYDVQLTAKSQCIWITAHYPDRSIKTGVWDSKDDPSTFYARAEEKIKNKYPRAIYSYLIPTEEEAEQINDHWMNQVWTWTGNKNEE